MLKTIKTEFHNEIDKLAQKSLIRKFEKQGIDHTLLSEAEFNSLVADEKAILEADSKKVGIGIGIGLAISLLTGI